MSACQICVTIMTRSQLLTKYHRRADCSICVFHASSASRYHVGRAPAKPRQAIIQELPRRHARRNGRFSFERVVGTRRSGSACCVLFPPAWVNSDVVLKQLEPQQMQMHVLRVERSSHGGDGAAGDAFTAALNVNTCCRDPGRTISQ